MLTCARVTTIWPRVVAGLALQAQRINIGRAGEALRGRMQVALITASNSSAGRPQFCAVEASSYRTHPARPRFCIIFCRAAMQQQQWVVCQRMRCGASGNRSRQVPIAACSHQGHFCELRACAGACQLNCVLVKALILRGLYCNPWHKRCVKACTYLALLYPKKTKSTTPLNHDRKFVAPVSQRVEMD